MSELVKNPLLKVAFTVTGLPDSSGLRIKSTEPTGLYISSADAAAAQWYFETQIVQLLLSRSLLDSIPGGGWRFNELLDWPKIIVEGHGEAIIRLMNVEETRDIRRDGYRTYIPPVKKLTAEWWRNADGHEFCIVFDGPDMIDEWVLEAVKEDAGRKVSN